MTSDTASLHVTLGISSYTWMDVFAEALDRCREEPAFREALPVGFGACREAAELAQRFAKLARRLAEINCADELLRRLDDRLVDSRRPLLDGQIASADLIDRLTTESVVSRPSHILFRLEADEEAARLRFWGKELRFPAFVEPVLRYIAEHPELRAADLPDVLDDEGKLVIVRRLVREGFLWPLAQ
jgi:hypothetical protein